eukprot:217361-Alexandrium_andersonii.AAC.1
MVLGPAGRSVRVAGAGGRCALVSAAAWPKPCGSAPALGRPWLVLSRAGSIPGVSRTIHTGGACVSTHY